MTHKNGFTIIEAMLIIVVIAIIGGVGYMAYTNLVVPKTQPTAIVTPNTTPIVVKDAKDLDTVDSQLDTINLDDGDSSQLDGSTADF